MRESVVSVNALELLAKASVGKGESGIKINENRTFDHSTKTSLHLLVPIKVPRISKDSYGQGQSG